MANFQGAFDRFSVEALRRFLGPPRSSMEVKHVGEDRDEIFLAKKRIYEYFVRIRDSSWMS